MVIYVSSVCTHKQSVISHRVESAESIESLPWLNPELSSELGHSTGSVSPESVSEECPYVQQIILNLWGKELHGPFLS